MICSCTGVQMHASYIYYAIPGNIIYGCTVYIVGNLVSAKTALSWY